MESEDKPGSLLSLLARVAKALERLANSQEKMTDMGSALERLAKSQEAGLVLMRKMDTQRQDLTEDLERRRQGFT